MKINKYILDRFNDNLSKEFYLERKKYSDNVASSIEKIVSSVEGGRELIEFMDLYKENLYVFGAGAWGQELVKSWDWKYQFRGFVDNKKELHGKQILGMTVYSIKDLLQQKNHAGIIIATRLYWKELYKQLDYEQFDLKSAFNLGEFQSRLAQRQYFDLPDLYIKDEEIFIDVGAFDGETSIHAFRQFGSKLKKVFLFEPDSGNVEKCKKNMEIYHIPYQIIRKGAWSESKKIKFQAAGNGTSCITAEGDSYIEVAKIDDELKKVNVTFIKMDIEGAEYEALRGCQQVIKTFCPKLAICIYHKKEDVDLIPELLLKYNPDYKLYLRHYSLTQAETVLYAI